MRTNLWRTSKRNIWISEKNLKERLEEFTGKNLEIISKGIPVTNSEGNPWQFFKDIFDESVEGNPSRNSWKPPGRFSDRIARGISEKSYLGDMQTNFWRYSCMFFIFFSLKPSDNSSEKNPRITSGKNPCVQLNEKFLEESPKETPERTFSLEKCWYYFRKEHLKKSLKTTMFLKKNYERI